MDKKEQILELLERQGEMVEAKISTEITLNQNYTNKYLRELEAKGLVHMEQKGNSRVWSIKKKRR